MKATSIQNILIAILIAANLILLGAGIYNDRKNSESEKSYDLSAKNALSAAGITVSDSHTLSVTTEAGVYDCSNYAEQMTALCARFFGCDRTALSVFTLPTGELSVAYGDFTVSYYADGRFSYLKSGVKAASEGTEETVDEQTAVRSAKSFLSDMGSVGDASLSGVREEDGLFIVELSQKLEKNSIAETELTVAVENDGKVAWAKGIWHFSEDLSEYEAELKSEAGILFSLTERFEECRIESIDTVYRCVTYAGGGYMLIPTYEILTEKSGESATVYVCAVTGKEIITA